MLLISPPSRYIYWSSKTEPKVYATRMNGNQSDHRLVLEFINDPFARIFGLSLNFTITGVTQIYWGVRTNASGV